MITRIDTRIVYRGELEDGTCIEDDNFQNVYRACLRELRLVYGHCLYFSMGRCKFSYGAGVTVYDDSMKYPRDSFVRIREIGELFVYSIGYTTQVVFRREGE